MIPDTIAIAQEARIAELLDRIADKDHALLEANALASELEEKLVETRKQLIAALEAQL